MDILGECDIPYWLPNNKLFYNGANLIMIGSHNPSFDVRKGLKSSFQNEDALFYFSLFDNIHPLVIRAKLRELNGKHVIGTINSSVVDNFSFESADHARKSIFLLQDDKLWGLNEDEAHEFYKAYEVGIQHVSEILLTSGLWR